MVDPFDNGDGLAGDLTSEAALGIGEGFDAGQWAMHGLLDVYHDTDDADRAALTESVIARIHDAQEQIASLPSSQASATPPHWFSRINRRVQGRRRRWIASGLIAASVLIGFILFRSSSTDGRLLADVVCAPAPPLAGFWIDPGDEAARLAAERAIEAARAELEDILSIDGPPASDPWQTWTKLYRNLRSVGRIDEALEEMHAFLAYAKQRNRTADRYTPYYVCLRDLGNTYQAIGDYETTMDYHRQSLAVARDYQDWWFRTGRAEDKRPQELALALANTLAPRLWALSAVSAAQGNLDLAWDHHKQARDYLSEGLRQECIQRGLPVTSDTPLHELCLAVAAAGDAGREGHVVKVREHLLRQARLLLQQRDLDGASSALELGGMLPDYPFADESRLDFSEPVEKLKIAIARGDYQAALGFADEAERHTGEREFPGRRTHVAIGVLPRAELRFLRGAAMLAMDPNSEEGERLINEALAVPEEMAQQMGAAERFMQRFNLWQRLAVQSDD